PDNSKVYVTAVDSSIICRIYQYDVSNIMPANIIASEYIVVDSITLGVNYSGSFDALQMAPDGKIYVARYMLDTLSVINNPNAIGAGCNFQLKGLSLSHNTTSQFGLPNFIDANYAGINLNIPDVKQCSAFPNSTLNAGPGFVSYQWSTGQTTDSIIINGPGKYWVTVINKDGCAKTDTVNAYLINPVTKDTNACAIYTANATQNAVLTYNWFDNNTNPIRTFTNSGVYWIDVAYIGGCSIRDTFDVTVNPLPVVNLGADTTFCLGNLPLNAFNPTSVYNWSTGQTTPSITATKANSYWVKVTNQYNCVAYDTLVVHPETSLFNFSIPNIVTPNGDNINDYIDFSKYQFSTLQLEIYNRWGLKVFESNDPSCVWKPNSNDNDGTYFTNIQYRIDCGADSQTKKINNFITLVR
ncbi:MAG TPA: gliding motility-associated C-terminal domain-containing protein, partial [Bacteroidia bacterium]|nr:gliding motility-associated C-terminal domain-containing protein [Bacteroidia bacterium]